MASYFVDPVSGDDTTGTGAVGTPWKTVQKAINSATTTDQINVKDSGADTLGATLTLSAGFTGTTTQDLPLKFRGYTSAENDGGIGHINGGTNMIFNDNLVDGLMFMDMKFSNYGAGYAMDLNNYNYWINCEFDGGSSGGGIDCDQYCSVTHCRFKDIGTSAIGGPTDGVFAWNYVNIVGAGNANDAVGGFSHILHNIVVTASTHANHQVFSPNAGSAVVAHNTIFASGAATGDAILGLTNREGLVIINNYIEGFSGVGGTAINIQSGAAAAVVAGNNYYNNATDLDSSGVVGYVASNTDLGSSGLTAAGSNNFIPTADLIEAGWPTAFWQLAANANDGDVGAVQKAAAGGGVPGNISGGLQ